MKPYCSAPWSHSCIHADGSILPCCVSRTTLGRTTQGDTLKSVWNRNEYRKLRRQMLEGKVPEGCVHCLKNEEMGEIPQKTLVKNDLKRLASDQYLKNIAVKTEVAKGPITLDLSLGNQCNLKCRFCGPRFSNRWLNDSKTLINENFEFWSTQGISVGKHTASQELNLSRLIDDIEYFCDVRLISLKGGEPLLNPSLPLFLQTLVEKGLSKKIEIHFNSNLTKVPSSFIELVPHFKRIAITASIDGSGKLYQYLRGENYRLENEIYDNILKLHTATNIKLRVHFLLCAYNIFGVPEFLDWFYRSKKLGLHLWKFRSISNPTALRVSNIPLSIRAQAAKKLEGNDDINAKRIIEILMKKNEPTKKETDRFKTYVQELDKVRGTNILDVVPEFKSLFSS